MASPSLNPEWIWGIGIIVLGLVIAFTVMRNRRSRAERQISDGATTALYRDEDMRAKGKPLPE